MANLKRVPDLHGGMMFDVEGEVRLDQLAYEIADAHSWSEPPIMTLFTHPLNPGAPNQLLLQCSNANERKVMKAAAKHEPDPNFIIPGSDQPPPTPRMADMVKKVREGEGLDSHELNVFLRTLADDWYNRHGSETT